MQAHAFKSALSAAVESCAPKPNRGHELGFKEEYDECESEDEICDSSSALPDCLKANIRKVKE
jgi:hypothetical protein